MLFSDPEEWTVSGVRNFLSPYVFPEWESKQSSNDGQVAASDVTSAKDMKKDIESLIDDGEEESLTLSSCSLLGLMNHHNRNIFPSIKNSFK